MQSTKTLRVKRLSIAYLSLALISCSSVHTKNWWEKPSTQWPQILLTNKIAFTGRDTVEGASAFLLYYRDDTVACTARHLIETPMGINPSVPQDSVNLILKKWIVYPRATSNFEPINITHLRNSKPSPRDFLVLDVENIHSDITALQPAIDSVSKNQTIYLIGCEKSDSLCSQNIYPARIKWIVENQIIVEPNEKFNAAGFSGAPAVNQSGKAVGIITGVNREEGRLYIYIEPISKVIPYIIEAGKMAE